MVSARLSTRVAIIGAGNVGATCAYALLLRGVATEIVLVDANREKAVGEAMDLNHSLPFAQPARIWAGDYADCAGAALTIITAGAGRMAPGQTRMDLIRTNAGVFREIVPEVARHNPEGLLLIASNPVDVMTYAAQRLSGLPPEKVIGSGTILDTARFRFLLSQHFQVDPRSVHAFIIGEHGDSEVPVWSLANIAGMRLPDFCTAREITYDQEAMDAIFRQTRGAGYEVISRKGATFFAIALGLAEIAGTILRDQNTVLSVSTLLEGGYGAEGVCLSLPVALGRTGVQWVLPMGLNEAEAAALRVSAGKLRAGIAQLGL
nr:L-lactate dehydrogenase [uncultured Holophaga sp.]